MGNRIVICHWDNGGHWQSLEVSTSALSGHVNHPMDIWPAIEDVTPGQNWPQGETIYLNNCTISTSETPSASPSASTSTSASPSATLPDTGPGDNAVMAVVGVVLIVAGAWLKVRSLR